MFLIRAFAVWLVLIAAEVVHGALRALLLVPAIGDFRARQAGVFTGSLLVLGLITFLTATIAAFIGAGGFGERITIGLALNDNDMLLAGAIPAAVLALLTQLVFEGAERVLVRRSGPAK